MFCGFPALVVYVIQLWEQEGLEITDFKRPMGADSQFTVVHNTAPSLPRLPPPAPAPQASCLWTGTASYCITPERFVDKVHLKSMTAQKPEQHR